MAVLLDQIRATAERVAASHNLELVELEFQGGVKFRTLRVFVEKNAAERAKLAELAATSDLPKGVPVEKLQNGPNWPNLQQLKQHRTFPKEFRSKSSPASPMRTALYLRRTLARCLT